MNDESLWPVDGLWNGWDKSSPSSTLNKGTINYRNTQRGLLTITNCIYNI